MTHLKALPINISLQFDETIFKRIQEVEKEIVHDVKSVEIVLCELLENQGHQNLVPFVHFGLTSQDVNSVALWMQLRESRNVLSKYMKDIASILYNKFFLPYQHTMMLAKTHGQPATPTTLGKEFMVFVERLLNQHAKLMEIKCKTKFGGATGGLNAHNFVFPSIDWNKFMDDFLMSKFDMQREQFTTQIDHYDGMAEIFDAIKRCNIVLIDLCKDVWQYISMRYIKQNRTSDKVVGSSTMPHKVNPINFENAEGNLPFANCILEFLSAKMPISRYVIIHISSS